MVVRCASKVTCDKSMSLPTARFEFGLRLAKFDEGRSQVRDVAVCDASRKEDGGQVVRGVRRIAQM